MKKAGQPMQELWVVAGLVFDASGRVLIAQRPAGKALAGRWEFPGGKVAADETAHSAIVRELREETGIEVGDAERLMYYAAVYPGRTIWLDVWVIKDWSGEPQGLDAQALEWVEPARLQRARHSRGGCADRCGVVAPLGLSHWLQATDPGPFPELGKADTRSGEGPESIALSTAPVA